MSIFSEDKVALSILHLYLCLMYNHFSMCEFPAPEYDVESREKNTRVFAFLFINFKIL